MIKGNTLLKQDTVRSSQLAAHSSNLHPRIPGFDLARAYAIFGMFIVNFNFAFGSYQNNTTFDRFQALFVGNTSSIFIILAGSK